MLKKGILILSHKGQSYAGELCETSKRLGLESYVLSSKPGLIEQDRISILRTKCNWIEIAPKDSLTMKDVLDSLGELKKQGVQVLACISVWENYRALMALANEILGASDTASKTIALITDKLKLRQKLISTGLSKVQTRTVTEKNFPKLKNASKRFFLKPRCGIASFGAFALRKETEWKDLVKMQKQMLSDKDYRAYFEKDSSFIAEDYIAGPEFSYEVIASAGKPYIIAIHEKTELQEANGATLENACVSPPVTLNREQVKEASAWLEKVFATLRLSDGCFHVEARKTNEGWEIVEINPRIGGAFIVRSTHLVSEGCCLLESWVRSLVKKTQIKKITASSTRSNQFFSRKTATFFRVYFAEPNQKIKAIEIRKNGGVSPTEEKFFLKNGARTPKTSREVFLGQMLWTVPSKELKQQVPGLLKTSAEMVEVIYAA